MIYPTLFSVLAGFILCLTPTVFAAEEDPAFNIVWEDIIGVEILPVPQATAVQMTLGAAKAAELGRFTETNLGKRVKFQINGHTTLRPIVQEKIAGGTIQLQVATLEEANRVISFFYVKKKQAVASPAMDAFAAEIENQKARLQKLTRQKSALRASGVGSLDPELQALNREISQLENLIREITNRYHRERGLLNR